MQHNPDADSITWDPGDGEEATSFSPAPPGRYLARCIEVRTDKITANGDTMWGLRHELVACLQLDGKFVVADDAKRWLGKNVWDNLVFSDANRKRVNLVLARVAGLDTHQRIRVVPSALLGKWAILEVEVADGLLDGKPIKRNKIEYSGYERAPQALVAQLTQAGRAPKLASERPQKPASCDTPF